MLSALLGGDDARSSDAVEAETGFEFAETPAVAAKAPAPTLRKFRRVVFISRPTGDQM
jgi:hypothetical protein